MLIELGPTNLVRGKDWVPRLDNDGTRSVYITYEFFIRNEHRDTKCRRRLANAAASAYGFSVDAEGVITNWDEVPHLWEGNTRAN